MKKLYTIVMILLLCGQIQAQIDSVQGIPATVPYTCDFNNQTENASWILTRSGSVYSSYLNHFAIGTGTSVAGGSDQSLYISNDATGAETYGANSESSRYFAERIIDFGNVPQNWVLELDWKASGYTNSTGPVSGLKVFLRDTADLMPDGDPSYSAEHLEFAVGDIVWRHLRIPLTNVSGLKTLQFFTWGYLNANARLVPAAIDNISITPATCDAPQFTVTPVGTRAVLDWQGSVTDTFLIVWRPVSGTSQDNDFLEVVGSSDTLEGLIPNTEYIAWMAKICDGDTSAVYMGTHFTTGCGTYSAPFEETFSAPQHCWTLDLAYTVGLDHIYTSNYVSPTQSINFGYVDTAKAISPVIDVSELGNPYLKFSRIQSEYNGGRKDLDIYYREYELDEWHYMGTFITPTSSGSWKVDSMAIPSHSATLQLGFFSIQHGNQQLSRISLDNIYVYDGPDCEIVSDVALAGQSGDTAFIHWVGNNPSGYYIRYRTSPSQAWLYADDLGGYAVITSLTPVTHYEVEVSTVCDSLVWIPCDFTTEVVATSLPYYTNFSDTADRGWQLVNGTCQNHWTMGVPGGYPQISNALFITNDGTMAGYNLDNFYTTVAASKLFNMSEISTVNIEFDVLCGGSASSYTPKDFLKVFFAPSSVEYFASESVVPYANDTAKTYAVNFHDYLSQTGNPYYDYKLNLTQDSVLHISVEMPNPTPNGESQLVFVWRNDYSTYSDVQPGAVITNVHVWQPTCDVVFNLQVNDIVGNEATVMWTPPTAAESFLVEYKLQGDDWGSATALATNTNSLILNGLSADTIYDVRVRVNCGNTLGIGNWRYTSFNTACAILVTDSTPYVEDFSAAPSCWVQATNPNHLWSYLSNNGAMYHQHHNAAGVNDTCPLYSPMMDISAVTRPYLKFSHQQQTDINNPHIDFLKVDYRTSSQSPWQTLMTYETATSSMKADSIPLPDTLNYIQIAFLAVRNDGGTAILLDDVSVYNGPSCLPLTSVTVEDVTANAAAISWKGYAENGYIVRYRDISDTVWNYETTTDTMLIISNLQGSTTYIVQVSGDCNEPNWLSAQLSTLLTVESIPYFTDFSPTSDRGWKLNNGECTNFWTMNEVDAANQVYALFVTQNGTTPGYDTTARTVVSAEKLFNVGSADSILVEFDLRIGGESRYDFLKLFLAPEYMEYPATSTADYNNPNYAQYSYTLNAFNFTPFFSLSNDQSHLAPYTFSTSIGSGFVHITAVMPNPVAHFTGNQHAKVVFLWKSDYMWGVQPGAIITNVTVRNPSCAPVSQLAVTEALSTTANISWTPGAGGETDWILEYRETSAMTWNQLQISGTPACTLNGLTPSTDYEVRVLTDCGNDQSIPVSASFTTTACDLFCPYTFILYDSHGDGWDGNAAIHVIQQGTDIASLVATNHHLQNTPTYDTLQLDLCHNENITLQWTWGIWWMENGVTVLDPDGNTVYTVSGMWNHDSTLTTFTTNCPFVAPTVVTENADNITQTEALLHGYIADFGELHVVERGFEWKPLFAPDFTAVTATGDSMSYPLTGLTPNTEYIYRAYATTDVATTYGEDIVFTTLDEEIPPCPTPTNLYVTDSADHSIGIVWTENGDAEQWNIQYRAGNGQMSSDVSTSPSYVINDLEPGTLYQIQVQSVCGAQTSGWSSVVTAMTTNTGIVDYDRYVKVWPNPTSDYINVECRMQNVEYGMQDVEWGGVDIVDVYGKVVVVETRRAASLQTRINVSSLSAGMYFVRVATDQGFVIKPFVKR